MHLRRLPVLIIAGAALCACAATPPAPPSATTAAPERTPYLGVDAQPLGDNRYVGSQPDADDFAELKAAGITKVINFRTPPEMDDLGFDEPQILEDLGIEYVHIPMGGDEYGYTSEQVDALVSALDDPNEKVLLHCTIGWRASIVTVAYLVREEGVPLDEAMTHAQRWWPLQLEKMLGRPLKLSFDEE